MAGCWNITSDPHSPWKERKILPGFRFALKHMFQALYALNTLKVFPISHFLWSVMFFYFNIGWHFGGQCSTLHDHHQTVFHKKKLSVDALPGALQRITQVRTSLGGAYGPIQAGLVNTCWYKNKQTDNFASPPGDDHIGLFITFFLSAAYLCCTCCSIFWLSFLKACIIYIYIIWWIYAISVFKPHLPWGAFGSTWMMFIVT